MPIADGHLHEPDAEQQFEPRRHLKVTGAGRAFGFEPCEDAGCMVETDGTASSCGRQACPACGCGGTNLSAMLLVDAPASIRVRCTCGHSWVREAPSGQLRPRALMHH
jgi:hypothetical protein